MRSLVSIALGVLGVALLVLCWYLRAQLVEMATSPTAPAPGDYPLLESLMPDTPAGSPPAKPAELARQAMWRIMSIGGGGLLCIAASLAVWLLWPGNASLKDAAVGRGAES